MKAKTKTKKTLTGQQCQVIGNLMVDILSGEISAETRLKLRKQDRTKIPEPYNHLVSCTRGSGMDGRELARNLLEELRIICAELQEK